MIFKKQTVFDCYCENDAQYSSMRVLMFKLFMELNKFFNVCSQSYQHFYIFVGCFESFSFRERKESSFNIFFIFKTREIDEENFVTQFLSLAAKRKIYIFLISPIANVIMIMFFSEFYFFMLFSSLNWFLYWFWYSYSSIRPMQFRLQKYWCAMLFPRETFILFYL